MCDDRPLPNQYKERAEQIIVEIAGLADEMFPLLTELGESLHIESNNCEIEIRKLGNETSK